MKFLIRSLLILLALYGIVFAVAEALLVHAHAPLWFDLLFALGFVFLQYLVSPYITEWVLDIAWDEHKDLLPAVNREFLERLCIQRGLKMPRIGIIYSGTPNAFTFGHVPGNARIVVTKGLLDILDKEESNAVLAHELGHVEHRDFIVMAVAALAPLLLYQIYIVADRVSNLRVVAYSAYLCYLLSQYVVLMLNRTREYFADHYSACVTHAPAALSSALIKIAYGLVREEGEYQRVLQLGTKEDKKAAKKLRQLGGTLALMGISNLRSGTSLALGAANPRDAAAVMRWDIVNPWSRLYQLGSTHPLTALRVRELNRQAQEFLQPVQYPIPTDQRVDWGAFPLQFLVWAAPLAAGFLLVSKFVFPEGFNWFGLPPQAGPYLLMFTGFAAIIRIAFRYRGTFQDASVGTLIEDVEVSQMRPRAVRLHGEVIGRGVPGAFWSSDLVLRDDTGMIFLLNRRTIPFARFFFAMFDADSFIGQTVEVEGWFRRALSPYVEISRITGQGGLDSRSYSRWLQIAAAIIAIFAGYWWLSGLGFLF
jgi:heat shock protein HtpX